MRLDQTPVTIVGGKNYARLTQQAPCCFTCVVGSTPFEDLERNAFHSEEMLEEMPCEAYDNREFEVDGTVEYEEEDEA